MDGSAYTSVPDEYGTDWLFPDSECPEDLVRNVSHSSVDKTQPYCESTYDTVLCWPATSMGEFARVPCPDQYEGVALNPDGMASKQCIGHMTWATADYHPCFEVNSEEEETSSLQKVHFIGHVISSVLLLIVVFIYCIRKDEFLLRTIQLQLLLSFFGISTVIIVVDVVIKIQDSSSADGAFSPTFEMLCKVLTSLLTYFTVSSFFWMFVESLYLFWLVIYPKSLDKLDGWKCALIGWGIPQLLILLWGLLNVYLNDNSCWFPNEAEYWQLELLLMIPKLLTLPLMFIFLLSAGCKLIKNDKSHHDKHLAGLESHCQPLDSLDRTIDVKKSTIAAIHIFLWIGALYIISLIPSEFVPVSREVYFGFLLVCNGTKGAMLAVVYFFFNTWIPPAILVACSKETELTDTESEDDDPKPYLGTVV